MNNWKKSTKYITFNSQKHVLAEIEKIASKNQSFSDKIHQLLNYEICISTKSLIATCAMIALIVGFKASSLPPQAYTYTITVINERGAYEKTY